MKNVLIKFLHRILAPLFCLVVSTWFLPLLPFEAVLHEALGVRALSRGLPQPAHGTTVASEVSSCELLAEFLAEFLALSSSHASTLQVFLGLSSRSARSFSLRLSSAASPTDSN